MGLLSSDNETCANFLIVVEHALSLFWWWDVSEHASGDGRFAKICFVLLGPGMVYAHAHFMDRQTDRHTDRQKLTCRSSANFVSAGQKER